MKPTKVDSPLEFIGPVDEDLLLAVAVLQGNAKADELAEFERRYVDDAAFNVKVGPLVELWLSPVNLRDIVAEVRGEAAPVPKASPGLPVMIPPVEAKPATSAYTSPAASRGARAWREVNAVLFAGGWVTVSVVAIFAAVFGYQLLSFTADNKPDGVIAVTKLPPKSPGPGGASGGAAETAEYPVHVETRRARLMEPEWTSERALASLDLGGIAILADSTESKTIALRGGSRLRVRPGSRVRYSQRQGGVSLEIFGEVAAEVTAADRSVQVISRAGVARLWPGSHAVRCAGTCVALEVAVARGRASIMTDRIRDRYGIPVMAGQHGLAFKDSAKLVAPAQAVGFPLPDSTLRKAPQESFE